MSEALAGTVVWLFVFNNSIDDSIEHAELAELRLRLTERLAGTCDGVVAALSQPMPSIDRLDVVVQQLTESLAADESLATDLFGLLDQATRSDGVMASFVRRARGRSLCGCEFYEEALAEYDEFLRAQPDDVDALCWSAVSLRGLGRHEDALARLRQASALEAADVTNEVLIAAQFLALGEGDAAAAAATRATELAASTPLIDEWVLDLLNHVWVELGRPDQAIAALEPLLAGEGEPSLMGVEAHLIAAQVLVVQVGDFARVVDIVTRLEERLGSLANSPGRGCGSVTAGLGSANTQRPSNSLTSSWPTRCHLIFGELRCLGEAVRFS